MKQVYLYLDESGNFEADGNFRDNPSLAGGVLAYGQPITMEDANRICGGQEIHCCEMPANQFVATAFPILIQLKSLGCDMVIFENRERLEVVDGDTTYLNIISEGVIQLLQYVMSKYGEVRLNIIIAVRVAVNREGYKNGYIIDKTEYIKRLQEKIIIGIARRSILSIKEENWNLELKSAKKDFRLMLADVVCHSWFRRNKKFTSEQQKELYTLYNVDTRFSVFPNDLEISYQRMMAQGNVGDAIFEVYANDDGKYIRKYTRQLVSSLGELNEYSREIQFQILFSKIMNLYQVDWNQILILQTLDRLKKHFFIELELGKISAIKFMMDIHLLALTIATHKGAIHQEAHELKSCEILLPSLVNRWESLDYYFIFQIRKGVHLINSYDAGGCIALMDEIEHLIDDTFSLFPLSDGFNKVCTDMKSDIRGKVLGTRLQARLFLVKNDPNQLSLARKDSDNAISEFAKVADVNRQYQYRCRIEYESGNPTEALGWLFKSHSLEKSDSFDEIVECIITSHKHAAGFSLMHFVCIMAEANIRGEVSLSENMHKSWNKFRVQEYLAKNQQHCHPYEIIHWKLATFLMMQGNITSAMEEYHAATYICDMEPKHQTLRAISLGIKGEKVALLMKCYGMDISKKYFRVASQDLSNTFYSFMNLDIPLSMKRHFLSWRPLIEGMKDISTFKGYEELLCLSRQIIY